LLQKVLARKQENKERWKKKDRGRGGRRETERERERERERKTRKGGKKVDLEIPLTIKCNVVYKKNVLGIFTTYHMCDHLINVKAIKE
jgi:hypothetical protein